MVASTLGPAVTRRTPAGAKSPRGEFCPGEAAWRVTEAAGAGSSGRVTEAGTAEDRAHSPDRFPESPPLAGELSSRSYAFR